MGWVRLDDGFALHPKVVTLSVEARWSYIEGLCYAAKYETDGHLPDTIAANGHHREALVKAGLWDETPEGVLIHDYLEYNPSKEQKDSKRQSRRLAGAIGAATRFGIGDEIALRDTPRHSKGVGVGVGGSKSLRSKESFALFWSIYPRRVGKRTAEAAFNRAMERAPVTEILAGAERLRDDPNRVARYTPHPSTWLNGDRWEDEALPPRGKGDRTKKALERVRENRERG